jgi:hypothetical protein
MPRLACRTRSFLHFLNRLNFFPSTDPNPPRQTQPEPEKPKSINHLPRPRTPYLIPSYVYNRERTIITKIATITPPAPATSLLNRKVGLILLPSSCLRFLSVFRSRCSILLAFSRLSPIDLPRPISPPLPRSIQSVSWLLASLASYRDLVLGLDRRRCCCVLRVRLVPPSCVFPWVSWYFLLQVNQGAAYRAMGLGLRVPFCLILLLLVGLGAAQARSTGTSHTTSLLAVCSSVFGCTIRDCKFRIGIGIWGYPADLATWYHQNKSLSYGPSAAIEPFDSLVTL